MPKFVASFASAVLASAGQVSDWADQYCKVATEMQSQHMKDTPEDMQKAFGEFAGLFASKVDCSEDPNNAELGFDLKGVALTDCLAAKNAHMTHVKQVVTGEFKCLETIADEDAGTGAIWFEFGNTGELTAKFKIRAAMRFGVADGVATNYHVVYDSYNLIDRGATPVKDWADEYCTAAAKMATQGLKLSKEDMTTAYEEFSALFAAKMDCSEVPNNPLVGFDLHDVSLADCEAAKTAVLSHYKKVVMSDFTCLETIADEAASTGTIFLEFGNSGALADKYKIRCAFRFAIAGGVATNYHMIYDTYNALAKDATSLSELQSSGMMVAGLMGLAALAFVGGMKVNHRKKVPLLQNEVVA